MPSTHERESLAPISVKSPGPGRYRVLFTLNKFGQSFIHLPHLLKNAGIEVDLVARKDNLLLKSHGLHGGFASEKSDEAFAALVEERLQTGNTGSLLVAMKMP